MEPRIVLTGTPQLVLDINPAGNSAPTSITIVNGLAFFTANDGSHGVELWKTDGTSAGTTLVTDLSPGASSSYPGDLANVNGTLFFRANDGTHGDELWKSDGTAAGTVMVADIRAGLAGSNPRYIANVN